ncbi:MULTISPECIES: glycosyltransferase [unclassified Providencia]|uniref:glycosyltransferase n=1 Tax=unclassified Providencia TaxID=2633465 RepID=UPI00234BB9C8|nr:MULTISPECIES: glycosyltransferase [unclassified Providencia]
MKNIIYCIPGLHNAGGMENVLSLKVNFLSEKWGYNIKIVTYQNPNNSPPFFPINNCISIVNLSSKGKYSNIIDIYKYVNKEKPDYFISLGGPDILFISLLSKKIKSILEWHFCYNQPILESSETNNPIKKLLGYIRREKNIFFAKKFNSLVILTNKDYPKWAKRNISSIYVINNPILPNSIQIEEKEISKKDKIKFISAGRLEKQKSFLRMIEIFKNTKFNMDWELNIYGTGSQHHLLTEKIKKYSLDKNIFIHSPIKNLQDAMIKSDFFILTSIYEGLPMVLLESISIGLPVIAFDCETGPSDIIKNESNGYLIENNNLIEYSKILEKLSSIKNYNEISYNAVISSKKFNIAFICNQWNSLFSKNQYNN